MMAATISTMTTTTLTPPPPPLLPRRRRRQTMTQVQHQQRPQKQRSVRMILLLLIATTVAYGFQLSPSTPPIEVLRQQLVALQNDDMETVYRFASPKNKLQVGGSLERFQSMIKSPTSPYRPLVNHIDAQILLESNMMESKQFLVRIINNNNNRKSMTNDDGEDKTSKAGAGGGGGGVEQYDEDPLLSLLSRSGTTNIDAANDDTDDDGDDHGDDGDVGDDQDGVEQTFDYWWSMSKCQGGEYDGSFMVDAVFPNFG